MEPLTYQEEAARIVSNVDKAKHPTAQSLCEEVLFMADRLKETRAMIKNAPVVIPYDNGGGQTGIRKNPMYEGYTSLFAQFSKGLAQLEDILATAPSSTKTNRLAELRVLERERKAQ